MALDTAQDPSMARTPYKRPPRGTRFCFTLNNWTEREYTQLTSSAFTAKMKWLIIAKETGDSNTPHLQGALILNTQTAFSTVKKLPGLTRAHLEPMHGSPQDSLAYCSKQDSVPFVYGTLPTPGKRNDLYNVVDQILEGKSIKEISENTEGAVAVVKFFKGLTVLRSITRPKRTTPPMVMWVYGQTGTGKTRSCFEWANKLGDVWISSGGLRWFDGYDGQDSAIFDDFRSKGVSFSFLLRLLDRYPLQVEFKGGFVEWTPRYIFITAPEKPADMFSKRLEHIPEDISQLNRRITNTIKFPEGKDDFEFLMEQLLPKNGEPQQVDANLPQPEPEGDEPGEKSLLEVSVGSALEEALFWDENFM